MSNHINIVEDYYQMSLQQDSIWQPQDRTLGDAESVEHAKISHITAEKFIREITEAVTAQILNHKIKIKRLSPNATLPTRGSEKAIGLDLYADLMGNGGDRLLLSDPPKTYVPVIRLGPKERGAIPTSIAIAIPDGYYARVAPRSGLALKQGVDVLAGVIDADYRGEVKVILYNTSDELVVITHGDRIAQLILERADILPVVEVQEFDKLDDTVRSDSGFGSTGA